jgi:O-antigen/teichoic acid export membrane protein
MTKKEVTYFAIGPLGAALFSLASLPLLAWMFTPEDVGRNNMYVIFVTLSMLTTMLGLDQAYGREYYETLNKPSLLKSCIIPFCIGFIILFLVISIFSDNVSMFFFGITEIYYVYISLASVFLSVGIRFSQIILRMSNRPGFFSIGQFGPKLIFLLALLYSAYNIKSVNFKELLEFHFFSLLGTFLFLMFATRSSWSLSISSRVELNVVKQRLKYGIPLMGGALIFWLLSGSSILILKAYAGLSEVAIYSIAMGFAGAVILVQSIFSVIWLPIMYKANAEKKYAEVFEAALRMVVVLVMAIFFTCASLSWVVRFLLPVNYEKVEIIFVLCMLQPAFYMMSEITVVGTNISRKTTFAFFAAVIALAATVSFCFLLVPSFGATGAAVANAIGFFIFLVARTEFSVLAMGEFYRKELYLVSFAMLFLALIGAILFFYNKTFVPAFWVASTVVALFVMRTSLIGCVIFIIKFITGDKKIVN